MYCGGAEDGVKGGQSVLGLGWTVFGGDADKGLGGVTDGGLGGYGRDGDRDRLNRREYNVAHATLGTEPNSPLAYDLGLELHHQIMSKLGYPGGRLEIEREI